MMPCSRGMAFWFVKNHFVQVNTLHSQIGLCHLGSDV